jgi:alkylation response protein AidB-like acyl-CoA dehydrogenase
MASLTIRSLFDASGGEMTSTSVSPDVAALTDAVSSAIRPVWASAQSAGDESAIDPAHSIAVELGLTGLGSAGALDAALAAQSVLGSIACPLPIIDAFVAGSVFGADRDLLAAVEAGTLRALVVTAAPERTALRCVETASLGTHVLVLPRGDDGTVELREVAGSRPTPGLAVPAWSDVVAGPVVGAAALSPWQLDDVRSIVRLGLAARAMGAAARAHHLATEHAKTRVQFGRPIGSFQLVQKRAVEGRIELTAYSLLEREAARLYAAGDPGWRLAAEAAVDHAASCGPAVALGAQHTLGAVGYFEEHEAPWLFRRAHADLVRVTDYPLGRGDVADALIERGEHLPRSGLGEDAEAFRSEVRAFLAATPRDPRADRMARDDPFVDGLADRGYLTLSWPPEHGGHGASVERQMVLSEELAYSHAPGTRQRAAADIIGKALIRFGSAEQQRRYLPLIAAGRFPFYLGYSESEAGSDLASLRTRAVRDGDGWLINGSKMWGTGAHDARYAWLAARTDPDAPRPHAGISVFLVPTATAGWHKQEHRALSGQVSCTTFFDDVHVGADALVGEPHDGWRILTAALSDERVLMAGMTAGVRRQFDELCDVLRDRPDLAGDRGSATRRTVAQLAVRLQVARLLVNTSMHASVDPGSAVRLQAPMAKIVAGELAEDFGQAALRILGSTAALGTGVADVPGDGVFERELRASIVQVVGGGTGDIQRTLIARSMGLPR